MKLILFDGECHFCDWSVQFIIKRDRRAVFKFAPLQSEVGQQLLALHQLPSDIDSFVFVDEERAYIESTAALRVCRHLSGAWPVLSILRIVPRPLRDVVYRVVARNRYRLFGRKESCSLPSAAERERFL